MPGVPAPVSGDRDTVVAAAQPGAVRIAVDLLGGDRAPAVVVDGALRALDADADLTLLLVGPPEVADEVVAALSPADRLRVTVRPVRGLVTMADDPTLAVRAETTIGAAVHAATTGAADAIVSAGSTGATVTAAVLGFGRWSGVRRPALAAILPAMSGPVVLLDVGGSLEARAGTLARHAVLGAAYAAVVNGTSAPRVGLLSVGVEGGKGDRPRRAADPALAAEPLPAGARYVGLVEGNDVTAGNRADVVVTDGFTGNILLKGIEGAYDLAGGPPRRGGAPRAAALLGVAGTVVVCHGAAGAADLASGIALAARLCRQGASAAVRTLSADPQRDVRPSDTEVSA
ncbi:phosphate acyltransferase PlsX [Plantactinospora sp. GCM10030261]|uniref:phosphate acyltransferase PlsX n=1 Tax=Plantactinospora sp. GCM10030261 TaxID=3273420 RepID=UPI0036135105